MIKKLKIASKINSINEVEFFFNQIFKDHRIPRKIYCKMYLSATEAVNNAIIHGNKEDVRKYVTINFTENLKNYEIQVADEGVGFDYNTIKDPRHPDRIMKESGRGIFIIKEYSDKVDFKNNGSTIVLKFNK